MSNKLRLILSCAVFVTVAVIIAMIPVNISDGGKMRKDMTAFDFAKEMGIGLNLGNTMEAVWGGTQNKTSGSNVVGKGTIYDYETQWGALITSQEIINGIKDAGFRTIRVPVYWGNGMEDNGEFIITDELMDRVQDIVDYCRNAGLYTVINIHHYDGYIIGAYSPTEAEEIFSNLWTQIAKRFRNYSDYVIFEGYNESLGTTRDIDNLSDAEKFDYVNRLNQAFVDAVRATGGNNSERMLVASGYWTNIDLTTKPEFKMPIDTASDRLMVSVHYVDNGIYWQKEIGSQYWIDSSVQQCELLKEAFTDKGIPVFNGECTAGYPFENLSKNAMHTKSAECLEIMLDMIHDYGFVPVIWDTPESFYSRNLCRISDESNAKVVQKIADEITAELGEEPPATKNVIISSKAFAWMVKGVVILLAACGTFLPTFIKIKKQKENGGN